MHGWCGGRGKVGEWKNTLVKNNITRDIDTVGGNMKALVPFVK
jgi:hypothetical protein